MNPHRIRLKGPWEFQWVLPPDPVQPSGQSAAPGGTSGRVKLPADWLSLFGRRSGSVRFRRRFQKPTNLEPHERVSIVLDGVGGAGRVWLNDAHLGSFTGAGPPPKYDVTTLLQPSNELAVEVRFDPQAGGDTPGGLWGAVVIEIGSDAASAK